MRRLDVLAIVLAVAAGALGVSAGTGPLAGGLAVFALAGLGLRARTAHIILVCAVVPLLIWATYPDPTAGLAALALAGCSLCGLLVARDRPPGPSDGLIASRVTVATVMVVCAGALLSFDLILR